MLPVPAPSSRRQFFRRVLTLVGAATVAPAVIQAAPVSSAVSPVAGIDAVIARHHLRKALSFCRMYGAGPLTLKKITSESWYRERNGNWYMPMVLRDGPEPFTVCEIQARVDLNTGDLVKTLNDADEFVAQFQECQRLRTFNQYVASQAME